MAGIRKSDIRVGDVIGDQDTGVVYKVDKINEKGVHTSYGCLCTFTSPTLHHSFYFISRGPKKRKPIVLLD